MARVDVQDTPNPRARRFLLDRAVQSDPRGQLHRPGATADPPVATVLAVSGVVSVLTLPSSLTVSVTDPQEWTNVLPAVTAVLESWEG